MRYSIIVLTYNQVLSKIMLTLDSILSQTYKDYEVIISDDASYNNYFDEIESYLIDNGVRDYRLINHETNVGTVANLYSAIKVSTGDYIRAFGAGDLFYCESTLEHLDQFISGEYPDIVLGLIEGYSVTNGKLKTFPLCHPFDIQAYRIPNSDQRIMRNMVLYGDNPSGAAICCRRNVWLSLLEKIKPYVRYEEDLSLVMGSLMGITPTLFDSYMISYEVGEGVSASSTGVFSELLRRDVDCFFNMICEQYKDNKYVKKRKRVMPFFEIRNLYLRTFLRFSVNPGAIIYLMMALLERIEGKHKDRCAETSLIEQYYEEGRLKKI